MLDCGCAATQSLFKFQSFCKQYAAVTIFYIFIFQIIFIVKLWTNTEVELYLQYKILGLCQRRASLCSSTQNKVLSAVVIQLSICSIVSTENIEKRCMLNSGLPFYYNQNFNRRLIFPKVV